MHLPFGGSSGSVILIRFLTVVQLSRSGSVFQGLKSFGVSFRFGSCGPASCPGPPAQVKVQAWHSQEAGLTRSPWRSAKLTEKFQESPELNATSPGTDMIQTCFK